MKKGRPPTAEEGVRIKEFWLQGLGSPKISQLIGVSSHRILVYMHENGLIRTKAEMLAARKANGINFRTQTVPKKSFQL